MGRQVVTFVNDTEEEISFKLYLKYCTGDGFTLGAKSANGSTHSARHSVKFLDQTQTQYVLYDSAGLDTGCSISSDDLNWKDNTVTVTKDENDKFKLVTTDSRESRRSSEDTSGLKRFLSLFRKPAAPHLEPRASTSGLNGTSNPETPEENV